MHPDVSAFVSDAFYEGRLSSAPECARQALEGGTGIRWLPVEHIGNRQFAPEEADAVVAEVLELVGRAWTDAKGETRSLVPADVMVVAPYNMHVTCLRETLDGAGLHDVRVGTVDKFQGQEAPVVFFSMASSSGDLVPRGAEFLFSRHRLNVAISRARGRAYLVCSPRLLEFECRTVEQMRLVNALCLLVERSGGQRAVAA